MLRASHTLLVLYYCNKLSRAMFKIRVNEQGSRCKMLVSSLIVCEHRAIARVPGSEGAHERPNLISACNVIHVFYVYGMASLVRLLTRKVAAIWEVNIAYMYCVMMERLRLVLCCTESEMQPTASDVPYARWQVTTQQVLCRVGRGWL
jgi:hypothetical protein